MRRSEQREHIFKLLFMTQFNSEDEMSDQVSMYFETLGELEEKDQEAMQAKYQKILEKLDEIDQILNDYSRGWKTSRMSRVDLTALRLAAAILAVALGNGTDITSKDCEIPVTETTDDGSGEIPYYKITPIAVTAENMDEVIVDGGFHSKEDVYLNVKE